MLFLLGVNHRSAPVELREQLHFTAEETRESLPELVRSEGVDEAMILSTCNRTEILLSCASADQGGAAVAGLLARRRPGIVDSLERIAYRLREEEAVRHLFRVAASLDSMIVGEPQILGQVKEAFALAAGAGTVGPVVSALVQRTFGCAKRIRTETGISRHPVSVAYAAAELAGQIFGSLEGRSILVLGAGKMGKLTARHLIGKGIGTVLVASRTFDRARGTANELGGEAVPFDEFVEHAQRVDILIVSTAAPLHVVRLEHGQRLMKARRNRPVFVVDLSVPRNVDPALNDLDNLFLYNIDALQQVADVGREERMKEAKRAESLVERELASYGAWVRSLEVQPTIVALRQHFKKVAEAELQRRKSRLSSLEPEQERAVSGLVEAVVNKLLHSPTVTLKRAHQERSGNDLVAHTRRLFGLDDLEDAEERARSGKPSTGSGEPPFEATRR